MGSVDIGKLIAAHRKDILRIASVHGATSVRLFGSAARGDSTSRSDIDLLVRMEPGRSYLDLVAIWQDLEELLGCKVDVVSEGGLSPYLRDRILAEATPL
jgi:predicted nucleotidyltransferase